ncbi:MAG: hypothetical protein H6807_04760 [Planctomycetes bacterium]|nr:hypothetical protein [Planctomycetota bacterium]
MSREGANGDPILGVRPVAPARVPLAVVTMLFLFVGLFSALLLLFADDFWELARRGANEVDIDHEGGLIDRWRGSHDLAYANELMQDLGRLAFAAVDPAPYVESSLWRLLRIGMWSRLVTFAVMALGVVQVLRRRPSGRQILAACFILLIALGAYECLRLHADGGLLVDEYGRDLRNAFVHETSLRGLEEDFPAMRAPVETPGADLSERVALAYFFLATSVWQLLLVVALSRPARLPTPIEESPCAP